MPRIYNNLLGKGIRYPFTVSRTGGVLTNEYLDRVNQSLFILFETEKGSRLMQPQYGSNIKKYRFDPFDEILINKLEYEIRDCISIWEPRVIVDSIKFRTTPEDIDAYTLYISIDYHIINTDVSNNFVYPFRTGTTPTLRKREVISRL